MAELFGRVTDVMATSLEGSFVCDGVDIFHLHNAVTTPAAGRLSVRQVLDDVVSAFE